VKKLGTSCLAVLLAIATAGLPAFGADEKPLGLIVQADSAQLEGAAAATGATVYPGDGLTTDPGGSLRLKVGGGQIYMLSQSQLRLAEVDGAVQASVTRGVVGFSAGAADRLELQTPEGILRAANGRPAYGQVALTSPTQMIISAYTGDMELDYNGDIHTINAGSSYSVSLEPDPAAQGPSGSGTTTSALNRHIVVKVIAAAVLGVAAYFMYRELCESPSKVK
jgi:hypothetical protein